MTEHLTQACPVCESIYKHNKKIIEDNDIDEFVRLHREWGIELKIRDGKMYE